jgi:hypothetical protein
LWPVWAADAVTAPFVVDRAMTGQILRTYVERCLNPP